MQYGRRKFMKILAVSAGAVVTSNLTGCGKSVDLIDEQNINNFLSTGNTADGSHFFPQSVVSGDPRPDAVILWTRIDDGSNRDTLLTLQVAKDEAFTQLIVEQQFTAMATADHCVKIRVTHLDSAQYYYYRFIYQSNGKNFLGRTGRTKTAPPIESDCSVKFAYVSCQDYIGRYYNSYLSVLDNNDLDFVVHLGDYIYETTGDPLFQATSDDRSIVFTDSENALTIGIGESRTQAANSLDNYRQLYKTYRSDELLQRVHERFPMIVIWDDHEFSDDSWGDHATYFDGARKERQTERKKNSEIAYFEYMPIDHEQPHLDERLPAGSLTIKDSHLYPNTRIYRDFHFGKHLHLLMTDFRTNRPDHLLPEDAFPATVEIDQVSLSNFLITTGLLKKQVEDVIAQMSPYINIDDGKFSSYKTVFIDSFASLYTQELMSRIDMSESEALVAGRQRAVTVIRGNLVSTYLNQILTLVQASKPDTHPVQQLVALPEVGVEQGLAFITMGKTSLFDYLGSRYFVIKDSYDLYAGYKEFMAQQQGKSVQAVFDDAQTSWLSKSVAGSKSTWKVLASSVSFAPLIFDFSASRADSGNRSLEHLLGSDLIPEILKQRFYLDVDQWDGFPQYKKSLINNILSRHGVISIGGDVHSSYVTEHKTNEETGLKSFNFTTSSISSGTFGSFLKKDMNSTLSQFGDIPPELQQLPLFFDHLVKAATQRDDVDSDLVFARMNEHGIVIVEVNAEEMLINFHNIADQIDGIEIAKQNYYADPVSYLSRVRNYSFKISNGQLSEQ